MATANFKGDDSLASVLKRATINEDQIALRHAQLIKMLSDIHDEMIAATNGPLYGEQVPTFLVLQAHQYFIGAIRIAMGGQLTSVFPLLRAGLESISYAILAEGNLENASIWSKREDSPESFKQCRGAFVFSNGLRKLKTLDEPLASHYDYLYEQSIKHGAHPNFAGVMASITTSFITPGNGGVSMRIINAASSDEVLYALNAVIRFGAAMGGGVRYALPKHGAAIAAYDKFFAISGALNEAFSVHEQ